MTQKELDDTLAALDANRKKAEADPRWARAWLLKNGFIKKDGTLHPDYGGAP